MTELKQNIQKFADCIRQISSLYTGIHGDQSVVHNSDKLQLTGILGIGYSNKDNITQMATVTIIQGTELFENFAYLKILEKIRQTNLFQQSIRKGCL